MANTRRIRHLGVRTRRFGRRRVAWPWTTGTFNSSVNITGSTTSLVMMDFLDFFEPTTNEAPLNGAHKIHRVMAKLSVLPTWQATTATITGSAWAWALYIADADDAAFKVWDATLNLFSNHQVLKWGMDTHNVQEVPSGTTAENNIKSPLTISFDLKFRRPKLLRPGEELILGVQNLNSLGSVMDSATITGFQRLIVQPAQAGK